MATEKRLIDARYLTSQMYSICEVCQTENIFIDAIIDEIDNAPDVDAVEVVHGRWEQGYPIFCSVCGGAAATEYEDANRYEAWLSPYCPNCGAKMDGDGNG